MLIVTDLTGKTEALTNIQGAEINEEVNADFSLSFSCFLTENNEHSYPLLLEESLIELEGHEFRVKKLTEINKRKSVFASHIFFDLIGHRKDEIFGGTKTLDEFVTFSLSGSGWTFENVDINGPVLIPNFGDDNAVALVRKICEFFECEVKIEPGKHLKFYKQVGPETDEQFRYGHNIKTLKRNVNTDNLYTVIKGYGGDGLEVTYRSPMADIYGERYADPVRDERYTVVESMIERLMQELYDVPEVSIDVEAAQLDFETELGMRLWLIHELMGMDFKTRIVSRKWFPFTKQSPIVTISNKKRTFTDLLTETNIQVKENQKETRTKFEQTNERFNLEVERIDESIANLEIEADNITLSVQSLDERVGSAEASLTVQANQISAKVDQNGVIAAINLSAEALDIDVGKINLLGITNVAETLTIGSGMGSVASIQFNGHDTWIYSSGDGLAFDSLGFMQFLSDVYFYSTVDFGNAYVQNLTASNANNANYLNGYSSSDFAKSSQGATISLNSAGTLTVQLANGKTANFTPSYWSG